MKLKPGHELKEFNSLYKELDELYHKIALSAGLSNSSFSIMYSIAEFGGGCLQKDIAEYYCISRKTVNSAIKNLERKGFIALKKGHRRDMHIYFTEIGQKFADENILPVIELENSVFDEFPPEERYLLLQLTRKYVALCQKKMSERFGLQV